MNRATTESPLLQAIREGHFLGVRTMLAQTRQATAPLDNDAPTFDQRSMLRTAIESGDRFFVLQSLRAARPS